MARSSSHGALESPVPEDGASAAGRPRRGGRPSRTEALQLNDRILDAATELFYAGGYGGTSIDAIAKRACISKRTFYHRFADKSALMRAVVHRTIERLRPPPGVPLLAGDDIASMLRHVAQLMLRAALEPDAIALHRLLVAEAARFPELAAIVAGEGGTSEAIALIAGLLERETRAGAVAVANPAFAAQQFLHMVIAQPQRRAAGLGKPMTPAERETWVRDVVLLFLNGCRGAR